MNEKLKLLLLKRGEEPKVVFLKKEHDYTDLKTLLGIDSPITVATRKIGGKRFDIWCDDEGLLKGDEFIALAVSIYPRYANEFLVGNLLIATSDSEGNTTGLSDNDIDLIKSNIHKVIDNPDKDKSGEPYEVVSNYNGFGRVLFERKTPVLFYTI